MSFPFFPASGSAMATQVDRLFLFLVALTIVVHLIVFGPMIFFLFKYRESKKVDRSPLKFSTLKVELVWIIIPLILVMAVFAWGSHLYVNLQEPPKEAIEVNVVGKQWMWKIQHPEGNREINELHVPVGSVVKLVMTSQDVIHSFFLPVFRIKQDVLPGRYTTEWFQATKVGSYHLFCAEYCGTMHSHMIGRVHVMEPKDYEDWLREGEPTEPLVQSGQKLFQELGCSGCHSMQSQFHAPLLEGIFGRPVPLEEGRMVMADEKYIRDSILLPQLQIAAGYPNIMPSFEGRLSEEEIFQLVAYIKNLSPKKAKSGKGKP
ncbi:MAG: cytochrome c oxidase subunit II [Verrucomicrobiae bacterium]|nr:cytochrome c oxidase subunit II [Verrucomicrobiae bacterium]